MSCHALHALDALSLPLPEEQMKRHLWNFESLLDLELKHSADLEMIEVLIKAYFNARISRLKGIQL